MKRFITRLLAKSSILALVFSTLFAVAPVQAASYTSASDTMSRQKASTASNHEILFVKPTATAAGENITINFQTFTMGSVAFGDIDFAEGNSNNCATASFTEKTLAATPSGATWGASISSTTLTLLSGTDTTTADRCLRVRIGTNASGGANQITNPSASTPTIVLGGTNDTGNIVVPIVDDDQVTVTATVAQTMSFDLDVGTTVGSSSVASYTVALGTLSTSAVSTSGDGSINMIGIDLDTNASGGAVVQVKNANGTNGLVSASVTGDNINTFTGTLSAGTEGYGICVNKVSATTGTLESSAFHQGSTLSATDTAATSTTCTSSAHKMPTALSTTFQDILNSHSGAISTGRAEVFVKASISTTTAAHDDYSDTLTFRATATF